jgi:hypothetical protein
LPRADTTISGVAGTTRPTTRRTSWTISSLCVTMAPASTMSDGSITTARFATAIPMKTAASSTALRAPRSPLPAAASRSDTACGGSRRPRGDRSARALRLASDSRQRAVPESTYSAPMHMKAISPAMKWWPRCSTPSTMIPAPMPVPTVMYTQF